MSYGAQISHVINIAGDDCGKRRFNKFISVTSDTTAPEVVQPSEDTEVKNIVKLHNLAAFDNLNVTLAPGPGCFGRVLQLSWCWKHDGQTSPTTVAEMATMEGFSTRTFGGVAVAAHDPFTTEASFNDSITEAIKIRNMQVGGKVEFVYMLKSAKFGTEQGAGSLVDIIMTGQYHVWGLA